MPTRIVWVGHQPVDQLHLQVIPYVPLAGLVSWRLSQAGPGQTRQGWLGRAGYPTLILFPLNLGQAANLGIRFISKSSLYNNLLIKNI